MQLLHYHQRSPKRIRVFDYYRRKEYWLDSVTWYLAQRRLSLTCCKNETFKSKKNIEIISLNHETKKASTCWISCTVNCKWDNPALIRSAAVREYIFKSEPNTSIYRVIIYTEFRAAKNICMDVNCIVCCNRIDQEKEEKEAPRQRKENWFCPIK